MLFGGFPWEIAMKFNDIDPVALLEGLHEGVVVHNAATKIIYANPRALELLRLTESQALGTDALDPSWRFIDGQKRLMVHQDFPVNRVLAEQQSVMDLEVGICDGSMEQVTWVLCNARPQFSVTGVIDHVVVSFIDITGLRSGVSFESVVANSNDSVLITEADPLDGHGPKIIYANNAFTEMTGYPVAEVLGETPRILQGQDTSAEARKRIRDGLIKKVNVHQRIKNYSKKGSVYWVDLKIFPLKNAYGQVTHFAAVQRDITEQVAKEEKLQAMAAMDPLTNLLNRRGFLESVKHYFAGGQQCRKGIVALIDIDFFKMINDSFGYECGDHALCSLAAKLAYALGEDVPLCRFGREDFAVFFPDGELKTCLEQLDALREQVSRSPLKVAEDRTLTLTVSIGLAQVKDEACFDQALISAGRALFEAKKSGRNRVELQIGTPKRLRQ